MKSLFVVLVLVALVMADEEKRIFGQDVSGFLLSIDCILICLCCRFALYKFFPLVPNSSIFALLTLGLTVQKPFSLTPSTVGSLD